MGVSSLFLTKLITLLNLEIDDEHSDETCSKDKSKDDSQSASSSDAEFKEVKVNQKVKATSSAHSSQASQTWAPEPAATSTSTGSNDSQSSSDSSSGGGLIAGVSGLLQMNDDKCGAAGSTADTTATSGPNGNVSSSLSDTCCALTDRMLTLDRVPQLWHRRCWLDSSCTSWATISSILQYATDTPALQTLTWSSTRVLMKSKTLRSLPTASLTSKLSTPTASSTISHPFSLPQSPCKNHPASLT